MSRDLIKKMHDQILESSDLEHDESQCEICLAINENPPGGIVSAETFTKEQLEAKVAEALAPIQQKLQELEAEKSEAAIDEKIAQAKAEGEQKLAEVQTELDSAKIDQKAAEDRAAELEQKYNDLVAFLEAEQKAAEQAEALEQLKAERVEAVKEAASFDEDYLSANAERWAKMDDELFTATLDEYKVLSAKAGKKESKLPESTKLETASAQRSEQPKTHLGVIGELRAVGFDARKSY